MREIQQLTRGWNEALYQGPINFNGTIRLRFLVLDNKLKKTEILHTFLPTKDVPQFDHNQKLRVNVANGYKGQYVSFYQACDWITPKWFIELMKTVEHKKNPKTERIQKLRILQNALIKGELAMHLYPGLVGCTYKQLLDHITSTFKPGMNWSNRGQVWQLDHIRPLSSFDLSKKEEKLKALHYTNLQALTPEQNQSKGDIWLEDTDEEDKFVEK